MVKAIAQAVEVEISFADTSPATQPRSVQPLGLVLAAGSWFVAALAAAGPAFVCIDALRGLRITRRPFERPPNFDLATAWRSRTTPPGKR